MAGARRLVTMDMVHVAAFWRRALLLAVFLLATLAAPAPAAAASPPPAVGLAGAERAQVEALIATLEDEAQRTRLVEQLRLLLKARGEAPAAEGLGGVGRLFFGAIADDLAGRIDRIVTSLRPMAIVEAMHGWIDRIASDEAERDRLLAFLGKLAAALAAGAVAEMLTRAALRRPLDRLVTGAPAGAGARLLRLTGAVVLTALPLAAFAMAAAIAGSAMSARPLETVAATTVVIGYAIARFANGVSALAFAPGGGRSPLLGLDPESGAYLHVWVGRFTAIGVYGVALLAALQPLGMPRTAHDLLLRVLGLVLVLLAIVVVLQSREAVASWIAAERRDADPSRASRLLDAIRGYAAGLWHVLAIGYLAMGYAVWALAVDGGGAFLLRGTLATVTAIVAARLASGWQHRGLAKLFRISADLAARMPTLEARANRYLPVLRLAFDVAIAVIALSVVLEAWGLRGFAWLTTDVGRLFVGKLASIAIVVATAAIVWELASALIERRLRRLDMEEDRGPHGQRLRTFLPLLRNAAFVVIAGVAVLSILSELGVNVAPLLAGAGVVGIAVGFGAQTLVKDVITGLFILFEDTVNVGDVVDLDGGHSGTVESLSIRSIRLRDVTGAQHTVPFSQVGTIKNMTKDFGFYVFDLSVAYETEVQRVVETLRAVDAAARSEPAIAADLLDPLEVFGLDRFGDFALVVRARIKTRPGRQWRIGRIYNERIKLAFDRAGIEIPYPHRVEIQKRVDPPRPPEPPEPPEGTPARA
jgi:small-conductance mechanosensitive channel